MIEYEEMKTLLPIVGPRFAVEVCTFDQATPCETHKSCHQMWCRSASRLQAGLGVGQDVTPCYVE